MRDKRLGAQLRRLRKTRGVSQAVLAESVGVTTSHISHIERGVADPSISILRAIARYFGVPMMHFFHEEESTPVMRSEQRTFFRSSRDSLEYQLLSPGLHRNLALVKVEMAPGSTTGKEPIITQADEVIYVLEGTVECLLGEERYTLGKGDSIYYSPGTTGHITNVGRDRAVLIAALTPPIF